MHIPGIGTLSKQLCAILAFTLLGLPLGATNEHNSAQSHKQDGPSAGLRMKVAVQRTVHPPRHKDHDRDHARDEAVIYNLSPAVERFSITEEKRTMLVNGGRPEQVQLTTVVIK